MKKIVRILAVLVLVGAAIFWVVTGTNRGWTKTSVPKTTTDEVTGLEGVTYEKKFVPGVDFLAAAAAVSVVLAGGSFLFRTKSHFSFQTKNKTQ
jgi:hypothetical protein